MPKDHDTPLFDTTDTDDYTPPRRPNPASITADEPCVVVGDNGSLMWVPVTAESIEDDEYAALRTNVASGVPGMLHGAPDVVNKARMILDTGSVESVDISWSTWTLTPKRDTLPDVIAAMVACLSRPTLNDAARDVMERAMPELTDPANTRDDVVY